MTVNQNDIIEVAARMEFDGVEDVINVYQLQYLDPASLSDTQVILDINQFLNVLYGLLVAAMPLIEFFRDFRYRNITQGTLMGLVGWPGFVTGEGLGQALPPGLALLVSYNTVVPRVGMRKYYGTFTEDNNDADGTWSAALTAVGSAVAAATIPPFIGIVGTYQFGYLSPKTAAFEVPVGATVTDIPAYQRRRRQGRGA